MLQTATYPNVSSPQYILETLIQAAAWTKRKIAQAASAFYEYTKDFWKQIAVGSAIGLLTFCFNMFLILVFPPFISEQDKIELTPEFFATVIIAPIIEEIIFRKFLLQAIKFSLKLIIPPIVAKIRSFINWYNSSPETDVTPSAAHQQHTEKVISRASVAYQALLFSAAHHPVRQPYAFVSGLVLGGLCEYYNGSIVASTAAHATNNGLVVGLINLAKKYAPENATSNEFVIGFRNFARRYAPM